VVAGGAAGVMGFPGVMRLSAAKGVLLIHRLSGDDRSGLSFHLK